MDATKTLIVAIQTMAVIFAGAGKHKGGGCLDSQRTDQLVYLRTYGNRLECHLFATQLISLPKSRDIAGAFRCTI